MNSASVSEPAHNSTPRRAIVAAIATLATAGLAIAPTVHANEPAEVISTASETGITDPLAFILSEHFPDLSMYPEFATAMRGPDRCRLVSPLPCS